MNDPEYAQKVLDGLKVYFGVKKNSDLAKHLTGPVHAISANAVSLLLSRNSIPTEKIADNHPELNRRFLITGEGEVVAAKHVARQIPLGADLIDRNIDSLLDDSPYLNYLDKVMRSQRIYTDIKNAELDPSEASARELKLLEALRTALDGAIRRAGGK